MVKEIARTFFVEEASRYAGVIMFSSQMLTNSDFCTGTFPAEYGNAIAGVSDMKLQNGNSNQ